MQSNQSYNLDANGRSEPSSEIFKGVWRDLDKIPEKHRRVLVYVVSGSVLCVCVRCWRFLALCSAFGCKLGLAATPHSASLTLGPPIALAAHASRRCEAGGGMGLPIYMLVFTCGVWCAVCIYFCLFVTPYLHLTNVYAPKIYLT